MTARELWDKGYRVTSRNFRIIARVDVDLEEFTAMGPVQRHCLRVLPKHQAEDQYRRVWSKDKMTLERGIWEEFLKIRKEEGRCGRY